MTSATSPTSIPSSFGANTPGTKPQAKDADPFANKETFLQLLVAQIKNQNPLSPQDGVQFLTQLAQFTDLEQSLGMRQDIAAIKDLMNGMKPSQPAV